MDQYIAVAIAAAVSAVISASVAKKLRLPWWAILLAGVVAWFGLALQLSLWTAPDGGIAWASFKLVPVPSLFGVTYAVVTRGMIGPPEGPLPRSR